MPWCDDCDRFWNPNTMRPDGSCPSCGRVLDAAAVAGRRPAPALVGAATVDEEDAPPRAPWHFKLMVVALVVYLVWRFWEGLVWLAGLLS